MAWGAAEEWNGVEVLIDDAYCRAHPYEEPAYEVYRMEDF